MLPTLSELIDRMVDPGLSDSNVIHWGSPIPSFGDPLESKVATLGLNPSNREFVDTNGKELDRENRRFHTLRSLELDYWEDIEPHHLNLILDSCKNYFIRNPYDGWFKALDDLISGTRTSYYDSSLHACHLDLIPYATACKWTELTKYQRSALLETVGDILGLLLKKSSVRLLVLNGRTVVENFEQLAGIRLDKMAMPKWTLPRRSSSGVMGYAYQGSVGSLAGIKLKKTITVLGFNHNIQSSFGVTNQVKNAIRNWITHSAEGLVT